MTTPVHLIHRRPLRLAGALAAVLLLGACSVPVPEIPQVPEVADVDGGAVAEDVGTTSDEVSVGKSVPADFPAGIPLPDRAPMDAVRIAQDDGTTWTLLYEDGTVDEFETITSTLVVNGFEEQSYTERGTMVTGSYLDGAHVVVVYFDTANRMLGFSVKEMPS